MHFAILYINQQFQYHCKNCLEATLNEKKPRIPRDDRYHVHICQIDLKCHCNEKIFDPILNTTEQHFHTSLNGVFSFSISCFVLEILRFFETCKLGVSDVIYSRIINYIYQMVNISVNSRQKFFKLCMTIAIW